ncbi:serine/threonine-protein phosphatase 4 regulatory subunit 1-like isoform X4 [Photinus pyralis]|uniref:serine/threonine-protein phosphatase 4 regulatory subunit 1-like isoform X4 n=1 Tax=Photinus pyralis TaxID=7054 RepID=UPI001266FA6D|nr:serine/threonine-protein phosphatase 4 regulatory subunit 1-like isoform X4 [Photinus pyralis]
MVPRVLLELFKKAPPDVLTQDLPQIMKILSRMSREDETVIRIDLLEQIPYIAVSAVEYKNRVPNLGPIISEHLLPIVVNNLGDKDNQIRKTAQLSLFFLLEKNLVTRTQAEIQVCPAVLGLSNSDTLMDYHTGSITLMSRLVPFLGREVTERVFLQRFSQLCMSNMFCVRKVCASHFGDFCAVIGKEAYDNVLLPSYLNLCADEIWGVRKACAEVIISVSSACSSAKRRMSLAPVFAKLLQDQSRWVRLSAFESLGPFISTFADPTSTRLAYNNVGELVLVNTDGTEFRITPSYSESNILRSVNELHMLFKEEANKDPTPLDSIWDLMEDPSENAEPTPGESTTESKIQIATDPVTKASADANTKTGASVDINNVFDVQSFDNLLKCLDETVSNWDTEPNVAAQDPFEDWKASNKNAESNDEQSTKEDLNYSIEFLTKPSPSQLLENTHNTIPTNTPNTEEKIISDASKNCENFTSNEEHPQQAIVPQVLIDHFVSMTDSNLAQESNNEMAYHCAYSLPAVALTLGSDNWHLLKNTVEVLAANMQYRVRRTVASSLYELAVILGPDIATNSLMPIFEGFIRDLDEVRIGVLKHLAHFLRLISPTIRNFYLPRLEGFLLTDNETNWRFRQELAEQLLLAVPLFCPRDACKHISFLAQELLCDKVAAVREVALLLVTELIRHMSSDPARTSRLLVKLDEKFAHSKRWKLRQSFALLCSKLLTSCALPPEQFANEVMPHFLDLSWDPVANVRLVVARTIAQHIITNEYFSDPNNAHFDGLQTVLRRLQADKDRDVRDCAGFHLSTVVQRVVPASSLL